MAILFWSQFLRIILSPVMVCLPTKVGRVMKTLWSYWLLFTLAGFGIVLLRVKLCRTGIESCRTCVNLYWFVFTRVGLVLIRVDSCWNLCCHEDKTMWFKFGFYQKKPSNRYLYVHFNKGEDFFRDGFCYLYTDFNEKLMQASGMVFAQAL